MSAANTGVVRLHNRPGDQTLQWQGACKAQRATGSGKGLCLFIFEGNFSGYDGPFTNTLTDTLVFDLQPSDIPCNRVICVISCQTSTRAPAFTPSQCFLIAMARRLQEQFYNPSVARNFFPETYESCFLWLPTICNPCVPMRFPQANASYLPWLGACKSNSEIQVCPAIPAKKRVNVHSEFLK